MTAAATGLSLRPKPKIGEDGQHRCQYQRTDIWRRGMCGPMQIQNLILRDDRGNFIDRFEGNITINRDPKQFQAPAAYLTGFVNQTSRISSLSESMCL